MPFKIFTLAEGVQIKVYKRKTSRHLRLSIDAHGSASVSIPAWAPYQSGVAFATSKLDWIVMQQKPASFMHDGQAIGKAHHVRFMKIAESRKPTARLNNSELVISCPPASQITDSDVQAAAKKGAIRALRLQAERLLPQRTNELAQEYGFTYKNVSIKQLKRRWGSCDAHKQIVYNLFLMQLPWKYIDYVILHELTHTQVMAHGPNFWKAMEMVLPEAKKLRGEMRNYMPTIQ